MSKKKEQKQECLTPSVEPVMHEPETAEEMVNKYGTYNIQPTADTENLFPLIAPGLPDEWKRMTIGKKDLENLQ